MYESVWRGEYQDGDPEVFRDINNEERRENIGLADEIVYFAFLNHPSGGKSWASAIMKPPSGRSYIINYWGSDKHARFTGSNKKEFATLEAAKKEMLTKIKQKTTTSHGYVMSKGSMSAYRHLNGGSIIDSRNQAWRSKSGINDGIFVFRSPERPEKDYCSIDL